MCQNLLKSKKKKTFSQLTCVWSKKTKASMKWHAESLIPFTLACSDLTVMDIMYVMQGHVLEIHPYSTSNPKTSK